MAGFPRRGWKEANNFLRTHARLQAEFAARLGLPGTWTAALGQSYERWDGKGVPDGIGGERIPLAVRIVTLGGGVEAARRVAAERASRQLDPVVVGVFLDHADDVLAGIETTSSWDSVIDAEPGLARVVRDEELDPVLEAIADLVDMESNKDLR